VRPKIGLYDKNRKVSNFWSHGQSPIGLHGRTEKYFFVGTDLAAKKNKKYFMKKPTFSRRLQPDDVVSSETWSSSTCGQCHEKIISPQNNWKENWRFWLSSICAENI
jgi:hypothetical protein